jgi:hypothetical protein
MRSWVIGVFAVLTAGAAQAQDEHYAKAGEWEVAIEPERQLCKMYRFYGSSDGKGIEGLVVRYDARDEAISLTWTTENMTSFPEESDLDLHLEFVNGKKLNDTWGALAFHYRRPAETHYFSHRFTGTKQSQRFLRDLAGNEIIGFSVGPELLSALFLEASDATRLLRECSAKLVGTDSPDVISK